MNYSRILNILLAAALVLLSIALVRSQKEPSCEEEETSTMVEATTTATPMVNSLNPTLQTIMARTSVRSYTDEAVSKEDQEMLLRAAMAAPTAGNKQPWQFVVVTDRSTLQTIADQEQYMKMAAQAPLAIVTCGDLSLAFEGEAQPFWVQDVSAATENILLASQSLGLGAVWTGVYPMQDRVERIQKLLGLPSTIIPLAVVVIGHPDSPSRPKDKWRPERVHYNTY
ncbi:MAG: nitroreductase family protein [Bacteroidales bacterium]|nr:nitroreductase family protein [Bacteroidales bacterium]